MSEFSFCLEAAALHDEDSSALTDAIERYVAAGMPTLRAQLAAIADVVADVRGEREQIQAAVREQHPEVVKPPVQVQPPAAVAPDPFRTFLIRQGVALQLAADFAPGTRERLAMGRTFRRDGLELDALAQRAAEQGFLRDPHDIDGMYQLIARAAAGERIAPLFGAEGEAELAARVERQRQLDEESGQTLGLAPEDLEDTGFTHADPEVQMRVRQIIAKAELGGVDAESILADAARIAENGTDHDFLRAAESALDTALAGAGEAGAHDRSEGAGQEGAERARAGQGQAGAAGAAGHDVGGEPRPGVREPDAPYETDLFGNPVPQEHQLAFTGLRPVGARPQGAGVRGNVQPEPAVPGDTQAPQGDYYAKTLVAAPVARQLGATSITSPAEAAAATSYLYRSAVERLDGIVTDAEGKPLAVVGGFKGALSQTSVYPSTLVAEAVRVPGAARIWFSHNHPSGSSELSDADQKLSRLLTDVFRGSGIEPMGLLAVAGGKFQHVAPDGHISEGGILPAESGVSVPVYERELHDGRTAAPVITSPRAAIDESRAFYRRQKGPGLLLLDAQLKILGWVPLTDPMHGRLRDTGGLRAIYRAVSEANAGAAIIVHGGELDASPRGFGDVSVAQNIGAALQKIDVRPLDIINAKTGRSTAEAGLNLAAGPVFKRTEGAPARPAQPGDLPAEPEARHAQIEQQVSRLTSDWLRRPDIHLLDSVDDAPEPVRRAFQLQNSQGAYGGIEGFHWRGGVYLVADALHTPGDVQRVLFHESLGHFGLRGVFGASLDRVLTEVAGAMPKELAAKAQQYGFDLTDPRHRRMAAEEVLAELAQTRPELGVVRRAAAAIRTWLRAHGMDSLTMTRDEIIRNFILPARGFVESGRQPFAGDTARPSEGVQLHRAYHGTPHEVDRFSTDKIGTGEGNQAYGHGLYFAENKGVGESYKKALSGRVRLDGEAPNHMKLDSMRTFMVDMFTNRKDAGLDDARAREQTAAWAKKHFQIKELGDAKIDEFVARLDTVPGHLYQVDVPDRVVGRMLLWDKPLSEQPEAVQQALRSNLAELIAKEKAALPAEADSWARSAIAERLHRLEQISDLRSDITGEQAYRSLSQVLRSDQAASQLLDAAGVPGIKYLDGQSRNRPLKDLKREFLAELPEDADFEEVLGLANDGTFSPQNAAIVKALAADDWLGFDYPAQAISAALSDRLSNFDASPALKKAVADAQAGATHNLVVFNDQNIRITHKDGSPVTKAERDEAVSASQQGQQDHAVDDTPMFSRTGTTPATEGMPTTAPESRWERSKSIVSDLIDEGLSRSGIYRFTSPMSEGSVRARATAQNFANAERLARAQWQRVADLLQKRFTPQQRQRMWEAADEQNTLLQQGEPTAGRGLERLTPGERDVVEQLHTYGEELLHRAKQVGMFKGEGLPYWTPRMMVMIDAAGEYAKPTEPGKKQTSGGEGRNVMTTSANLKQRKYLTAEETEAAMKAKGGEMVRDIMTMPLAMQRLEKAIAGRELINQIRELGRATGEPTVSDGRPDHDGFFTLDHPAFTTFTPKQVPVRLSEYFDRKLMDGLTQLADNLGIAHERKGALKGGALGLAYRDKPLVQTQFLTPDQVLTHEIGHQIDFKYGLADQLTKRGATAKELRALADLRFEGQEDEVSDHYKTYVRKASEKIANLVHAYVHNPERFRAVAPETFQWFDEFVNRTPELAPLKDLGPSLTLGKRDIEGKVTQWEQKPLYMSKEFEGPVKAILSNNDGALYRAFMLLKSKAMSAIMFSPLIHNLVIFGRALGYDPTMAGTVALYFKGHVARGDNALFRTAIEGGMVPMGYHRQGMIDITDVARGFGKEGGWLDPHESWIAHGAQAITKAAFGKVAGAKVKGFIDKAGDFWHGTLLWDRVADLQMGIFAHAYQRLQDQGFAPGVARVMAAHWANRYAGAIARENMGEYARKAANVLLFSRSFNMGNLGTVKDLAYGMPSGLRAKIEAEYGRAAASKALTEARRKAWSGFVADAAMSLVMLSLAQSVVDRLKKDKGWDEIFGGYTERAQRMWENIKAHPAKPTAYSPWQLSPTHDNEPGKQDRVDMGQLPDAGGRHEYMRLPTGKVVEDLFNWTGHFPTTFESKMSPLAKSVMQTLSNDKGFGVPVYDPNGSVSQFALDVAKHLAKAETPWDTIITGWDKLHGRTTAIENDKLVGNVTGFSFSQGHPQGPEAGVAADVEARIKAQRLLAMEEVKRLLKYDREDEARQKLEDIGLAPREVTQILKHLEQPKEGMTRGQQKRFNQHGSEEDQQRMDRVTQ